MLRTKLEALAHPTPDKVDYNNRTDFAINVLWLEDQKIRLYRIEDRENLRKFDNLALWEEAYERYKSDLKMPEFKTPLEELSYLCSYAVRLEYLDSPDDFKNINSQISLKANNSTGPSVKAENFFDNFDFNSKDFIAGVRSLADKLRIPHHPNHLLQLEAIARVVHERLSQLAARDRKPIKGIPFPFEKGDDVVAAKDPGLDFPVRILRLLQIQSLRELQTRINETIVSVQDLTANPKTDTKLGKVGR